MYNARPPWYYYALTVDVLPLVMLGNSLHEKWKPTEWLRIMAGHFMSMAVYKLLVVSSGQPVFFSVSFSAVGVRISIRLLLILLFLLYLVERIFPRSVKSFERVEGELTRGPWNNNGPGGFHCAHVNGANSAYMLVHRSENLYKVCSVLDPMRPDTGQISSPITGSWSLILVNARTLDDMHAALNT